MTVYVKNDRGFCHVRFRRNSNTQNTSFFLVLSKPNEFWRDDIPLLRGQRFRLQTYHFIV